MLNTLDLSLALFFKLLKINLVKGFGPDLPLYLSLWLSNQFLFYKNTFLLFRIRIGLKLCFKFQIIRYFNLLLVLLTPSVLLRLNHTFLFLLVYFSVYFLIDLRFGPSDGSPDAAAYWNYYQVLKVVFISKSVCVFKFVFIFRSESSSMSRPGN